MFRYISCFVLLIFSLSYAHAFADPVKLSAEEISQLLNGKKIKGDWNGTPYEQDFYTNGVTIYFSEEQSGFLRDEGHWRVNRETHQYESKWRSPVWSQFDVYKEAEIYYWGSSNGKLRAFELVPD